MGSAVWHFCTWFGVGHVSLLGILQALQNSFASPKKHFADSFPGEREDKTRQDKTVSVPDIPWRHLFHVTGALLWDLSISIFGFNFGREGIMFILFGVVLLHFFLTCLLQPGKFPLGSVIQSNKYEPVVLSLSYLTCTTAH